MNNTVQDFKYPRFLFILLFRKKGTFQRLVNFDLIYTLGNERLEPCKNIPPTVDKSCFIFFRLLPNTYPKYRPECLLCIEKNRLIDVSQTNLIGTNKTCTWLFHLQKNALWFEPDSLVDGLCISVTKVSIFYIWTCGGVRVYTGHL